MHPVANEVPVPTDGIERELLALAERRFTGRARLTLRVKPEAGLDVEVLPTEATETVRMGDRAPQMSPQVFHSGPPTERELAVRELLTKNAYRFRLTLRLVSLVCDFKEGLLLSTQFVTVG